MHFSKRFDQIEPSMIRQVLIDAAGPDMINLSPGFPDQRAFPLASLQRISDEIFKENPYRVLQYAPGPILPELKEALIPYLNRDEDIVKDGDDVTVTAGSGEGLEMAAKVLCDPGEIILCEDPTFVGALNGFKSNGAKLIGIPMDEEGPDLNALKNVIATARLFYVIPNFQNPTTRCMSLKRRKDLLELASHYDLMILEDDPYGALRFHGERLPSLKALDTHHQVVYFSSLSKVIAPGLRLGAVAGPADVIAHFNIMKGASAGAATSYSQLLIAKFLKEEDIPAHLERLQKLYQEKSEWMVANMKKYFHPDVRFRQPDGGMFVWFEVPENSELFFQQAVRSHIAIVPERTFAVNTNRALTGFRLSFTSASMTQIEKAMKILGDISYAVL